MASMPSIWSALYKPKGARTLVGHRRDRRRDRPRRPLSRHDRRRRDRNLGCRLRRPSADPFIVAYIISVAVFVPATLLTLAGGMLFGPIWGTLYNLSAAAIAATLMILIARYVAGDVSATRAGRRLRAIMAGVDEEGWRFVFLLRLIPGIPFAVLNYALGLTHIRLGPYALATLLGMVPAALVINYVGYAGREAALGGEAIAEKALIGLVALASLALVTRLVMKLRRRRLVAPTLDAPRDSPK
ncbi:MAG: TVP38/TMEM64 family protein [Alphaproteobacteria bacterium]|nr:TVP38/TMEM64 family protein [Alphaproteobacteria bacterium]